METCSSKFFVKSLSRTWDTNTCWITIPYLLCETTRHMVSCLRCDSDRIQSRMGCLLGEHLHCCAERKNAPCTFSRCQFFLNFFSQFEYKIRILSSRRTKCEKFSDFSWFSLIEMIFHWHFSSTIWTCKAENIRFWHHNSIENDRNMRTFILQVLIIQITKITVS